MVKIGPMGNMAPELCTWDGPSGTWKLTTQEMLHPGMVMAPSTWSSDHLGQILVLYHLLCDLIVE